LSQAYREANKDSVRVRMELMIMRIQKEFCKALEQGPIRLNLFGRNLLAKLIWSNQICNYDLMWL
jgi:hypothetical protein